MSIFSDALAERIRLGKYARWAADITEDQMEGLLWLLGEWGYRRELEPGEEAHGAQRRAFAAREAIHDFIRSPLTKDEVIDLMRSDTHEPPVSTGEEMMARFRGRYERFYEAPPCADYHGRIFGIFHGQRNPTGARMGLVDWNRVFRVVRDTPESPWRVPIEGEMYVARAVCHELIAAHEFDDYDGCAL